jgi:hypothetical protein
VAILESDAMDDHLVGYLLNTLDPVTHQRVEAYLHGHSEARAQLALLEEAIAPLQEDYEIEPPPGLAFATLARISEYRCALPIAPRPSPHQHDLVPRRWGRPVDWLVAAVLLILVGGLVMPLLARQWREQRRLACENNLRKFWVGLQAYADRTDNDFPRVEAEGARGVAGIFVPILTDCGLLKDVSIACPAQGQQEPLSYTVVDLEQLFRTSPVAFRSVAHDLAGHYAYCLGYEDGQTLRGLRRDTGDGLPILADYSGADAHNSSNHAGAGQNVLYVGGNVRWCVLPTVGLDGDNIYVNHQFRVRAGLCHADTVLGASDARPYQE